MMGLLLTYCTWGLATETVHITELDANVFQQGGYTFSTYCTAKLASEISTRRLAIAGAARAIVRARFGAAASGSEAMHNGEFHERIQEDTLGVVNALEVVGEDPAGGFARDLWCVKVKEAKNNDD